MIINRLAYKQSLTYFANISALQNAMSQPASPATGCRLKMFDVRVGKTAQTYLNSSFRDPLTMSLEGRKSPETQFGVLGLVISAGSTQMVRYVATISTDHILNICLAVDKYHRFLEASEWPERYCVDEEGYSGASNPHPSARS